MNTAAGAPRSLSIGLPDLILSAILVGYRTSAGSSYHRILRDASIDRLVRAFLETDANGNWVTTEVFRELEATEKSGASFRLGMMFAQVVAEGALGTLWLKHYAKTHGGRADLVGVDAKKPLVGPHPIHVIEAKGRSDRAKRSSALAKGKAQVNETSRELAAGGDRVSRAAVCVSVLDGGPIEVFLKDPPTSDDGSSQSPALWNTRLTDFYGPVLDTLDEFGPSRSGIRDIDEGFEGNFLPGTTTWIGMRRELFAAREEFSLEGLNDLLFSLRGEDSPVDIERFNGVVRKDGIALISFDVNEAGRLQGDSR